MASEALIILALMVLSFAGGLVLGAWLVSVPETPSFVEGAMQTWRR